MRFAVLRKLIENNLCMFNEIRHSDNWLFQGRKEIIPMNRYHKTCLCLLHRFRKEALFRRFIRFRKTRHTKEQYIRLDIIQLSFNVIEAGADQDLLILMLDVKII